MTKRRQIESAFVIDDPEFTKHAFLKNPFKWVDAETWEFRHSESGNVFIEKKPLESFPSLYNGISAKEGNYVLCRKDSYGQIEILAWVDCRHLVLQGNGKLEMSDLPLHHKILASIMSMGTRDVTVFSPKIQIDAIQGLDEDERDRFYEKLELSLLDQINQSVDPLRKCFVFYYLIYAEMTRYQRFQCIVHKKKEKFNPSRILGKLPREFIKMAYNSIGKFSKEHDVIRESEIEVKIMMDRFYQFIKSGPRVPVTRDQGHMAQRRVTAGEQQQRAFMHGMARPTARQRQRRRSKRS